MLPNLIRTWETPKVASSKSNTEKVTSSSHGLSFKPNLTPSALPPAVISTSTRRRLEVTILTTQSPTLALIETSKVPMRTSLLLKRWLDTISSWEPRRAKLNGQTQPKKLCTITHQSSTRIWEIPLVALIKSRIEKVTNSSHGTSFSLLVTQSPLQLV